MGADSSASNQECKDVVGEYSLNIEEVDGIVIDKETSKISLDTTKQIPKTSLIVTAKIGTQQRVSDPFDIEVFDCNEGLTHGPDIQLRISSMPEKVLSYDLLKTKPTHPSCSMEIVYKVEGLTEAVTFATDVEEKGKVKIDSSVAMDTVVKYTATIGKQEFKNELKVEIYDCLQILEFTK